MGEHRYGDRGPNLPDGTLLHLSISIRQSSSKFAKKRGLPINSCKPLEDKRINRASIELNQAVKLLGLDYFIVASDIVALHSHVELGIDINAIHLEGPLETEGPSFSRP